MTQTETTHCISSLLSRLGMTANYTGFYHTCDAIAICIEKPECLRLVTKWLYPEVARHCNTSAKCVERNIRTMVNLSWKKNPKLLSELAQHTLNTKPSNAEFIAILTAYIRHNNFS